MYEMAVYKEGVKIYARARMSDCSGSVENPISTTTAIQNGASSGCEMAVWRHIFKTVVFLGLRN